MNIKIAFSVLMLGVSLHVIAKPTTVPIAPLPSLISTADIPASVVHWDGGNAITICPVTKESKLTCKKGAMPHFVGPITHIERALPIPEATGTWMAFSPTRISLCAMKAASTAVICQRLQIANLALATVAVTQSALDGSDILTFDYQDGNEIPDEHMEAYANGLAHEIAAARGVLENLLRDDSQRTTTLVDAGGCTGGIDDTGDWDSGDCNNSGDGAGGTGSTDSGPIVDPGPIVIGGPVLNAGGKNPVCVAGCLTVYQRISLICAPILHPVARIICQGGAATAYLACYTTC